MYNMLNRWMKDKKVEDILKVRISLLALLLLIIAALPHIFAPNSDITLDEADYVRAAQKGFIANSFDLQGTRITRHYHGPMLAHLVHLSTSIFGVNEFAIKLPNRIISVLTVLLIFFGCIWVIPKKGVWIGFLSALLLGTLSTYIQVGGVANMHTLTNFLSMACFFLTIKIFQQPQDKYLYWIAFLLALNFTSMEYAYVSLAAMGICLLLFPNPYFHISKKEFTFSSKLFIAIGIIIVTMLIFWSASLLKLNILRNFVYYLRYSSSGHPIHFRGELTRHVPWWAYIYWFFKISPMWIITVLLGLGYSFIKLYKTKEIFFKIFTVFNVIFLAALFKQHIMSARYAIYMLPFLSIAGGLLLYDIAARAKKAAPVLVLIFFILLGYTSWDVFIELNFKSGDHGYQEAAAYLTEHIQDDETILTWYKPVLEFYFQEDNPITNYNSGGTDHKVLQLVRDGNFTYVLYYQSQVRRWPEDKSYLYVKENFELVYTHTYNGREWLWLYKMPE